MCPQLICIIGFGRLKARHVPKFNVTMIKALSSHFELPYNTREVKTSLLSKPRNMVE